MAAIRLVGFPPALRTLRRPGPATDLAAAHRAFAPYGGLLPDYLLVQAELGPCALKSADEPENCPAQLLILPCPIIAIHGYYHDDQILRYGAKGDVLIVANESTGCGFGYDTGLGPAHVTCDKYLIVCPMTMSFAAWCLGTIACWTETPVSCPNGALAHS